jgi:hypothetical protein
MTITFYDIHTDTVREVTQDDFDMHFDCANLEMKRTQALRGLLAADISVVNQVYEIVKDLAAPQPYQHTPRPSLKIAS